MSCAALAVALGGAMSLYGSIQLASNTLQAMQIGLHVVGNNIANANTPGYARERVLYATAPVQQIGDLTLGLGVKIEGIVQSKDNFLESRLRDAGGDLAGADIQNEVYGELESILGELSDSDLSTSLSSFFNSINEVLNQPESNAIRNLVAQSGKTLTTQINTLSRRVETVHGDFSRKVENLASEINSLSESVRKLNLQIVTVEGGNRTASEAGALRSQRNVALNRLVEITGAKVTETDAGAANVAVGGEFLVFEGTRREVGPEYSADNGLEQADIKFLDNGSTLQTSRGELAGIYEARDRITGGFLDRLDEFAAGLIYEFNRVYSQGQGATGFDEITSQERVTDAGQPLDAAGLDFAPGHGTFQILQHNTKTGLTTTHVIPVNLNGLAVDTTLSSLAASIDAIEGVQATVTSDNRLEIAAESNEVELGFANDTSGVLASLGLNTFFTGSGAGDVAVNDVVLSDGSKFAAALDGVGVGTENAQRLIGLYDTGLDSLGGTTITGAYDQLLNEVTQGATVAASVRDGFDVFYKTLEANAQAVSGVNLDEEAVDLILLQRTYQASAKFISTISELLDVLVNL